MPEAVNDTSARRTVTDAEAKDVRRWSAWEHHEASCSDCQRASVHQRWLLGQLLKGGELLNALLDTREESEEALDWFVKSRPYPTAECWSFAEAVLDRLRGGS